MIREATKKVILLVAWPLCYFKTKNEFLLPLSSRGRVKRSKVLVATKKELFCGFLKLTNMELAFDFQ